MPLRLNVQPPAWDDFSSGEDSDQEDDERPLTREELKRKTLRGGGAASGAAGGAAGGAANANSGSAAGGAACGYPGGARGGGGGAGCAAGNKPKDGKVSKLRELDALRAEGQLLPVYSRCTCVLLDFKLSTTVDRSGCHWCGYCRCLRDA